MMLTNDVAELSDVVILTSVDVTLDTNRRDCSFNGIYLGGTYVESFDV